MFPRICSRPIYGYGLLYTVCTVPYTVYQIQNIRVEPTLVAVEGRRECVGDIERKRGAGGDSILPASTFLPASTR
eukprot:352226-Chlamydomonas_euryale.AAC.3